MTYHEIEKKAGVYKGFLCTIGKPERCKRPNLASLIAVGQVLGLELTWRTRHEQ